MPNRHESSDKYRYGFQGQVKDDEIKGEGNSINYKFRMHDPRVGRFFAVDPLTKSYPWYTPYSFSGNKVIAFVELEGLEEKKITSFDQNIRYYHVQKGDNVWNIAKTTGVAYKDILKWNTFPEGADKIKPNQLLYLQEVQSTVGEQYDINFTTSKIQNQRGFIEKSNEFFTELTTSNENGPSIQREASWVLNTYALGRLSVSGNFLKQSWRTGLMKTGVSALIQAIYKDGEVNTFAAFSDGFMNVRSNAASNIFELNVNFKTGDVTSRSLFGGTKSISETIIDGGSSTLFGTKNNIFAKYLDAADPVGKAAGDFILNSSNQLGNYGVQKSIKNSNDENENK